MDSDPCNRSPSAVGAVSPKTYSARLLSPFVVRTPCSCYLLDQRLIYQGRGKDCAKEGGMFRN